MKKDVVTTIALGLEGTLIKDQLDPRPRPGLYHFLNGLALIFSRIVIMTTVPKEKFREIAQQLGTAPSWFCKEIKYVNWQRPHKDLLTIPGVTDPAQAFLVDDCESYVKPDQKDRWIQIETFFDQKNDRELYRVGNEIRKRMDRPLIHYGNGGTTPFIRISDLPADDRETFTSWLRGCCCPAVDGEKDYDCTWPHDYERWRKEVIYGSSRRWL